MKIVWIIFQKWCLLSSQSSTFRISTLTQFSVIDFFPRFTIGVKDRIFKVDIFLKNMGQYNCMTADTMTSSPLIRLQRPLPPSGDAILNNENSLFWIGLFKQFLISFSKKIFDSRFKIFLFPVWLNRSLFPEKGESLYRFLICFFACFNLFVGQFWAILNRRGPWPQAILTLMTHIQGFMSHMSHSDVIYLVDRK